MINIISKSYYSRNVSGPKKVVDNLIKGLKQLGYPYVVNKRLDACLRLWIHDDISALQKVAGLPKEIKVLVGPNLFILPGEIPAGLDLSHMVYLQPSEWVKILWESRGFNRCPIEVWPVGVDTEAFMPQAGEKDLVLVYFKQRSAVELAETEGILKDKGINYKVINYGHYQERDYRTWLSKTRYIVWLGQSESQGLALLEAMSSGVPVLVCDSIQNVFNFKPVFNVQKNLYIQVTSAPYFDGSCGLKIQGLKGLGQAVERMQQGWRQFSPKVYIERNLGLLQQAENFLQIYQSHFNLPIATGYKEEIVKTGDWVNKSWLYRFKFFINDVLKCQRDKK